MNHDEAMGYIPTKEEIIREIRKHCLNPDDFFKEVRGKITGKKVLRWLGY